MEDSFKKEAINQLLFVDCNQLDLVSDLKAISCKKFNYGAVIDSQLKPITLNP
jgi:hypothetical protein